MHALLILFTVAFALQVRLGFASKRLETNNKDKREFKIVMQRIKIDYYKIVKKEQVDSQIH